MSIDELIALQPHLTERQKKLLKQYYEKGDEENNKDYVYGEDEGEACEGGIIG